MHAEQTYFSIPRDQIGEDGRAAFRKERLLFVDNFYS